MSGKYQYRYQLKWKYLKTSYFILFLECLTNDAFLSQQSYLLLMFKTLKKVQIWLTFVQKWRSRHKKAFWFPQCLSPYICSIAPNKFQNYAQLTFCAFVHRNTQLFCFLRLDATFFLSIFWEKVLYILLFLLSCHHARKSFSFFFAIFIWV